MIRPSPALTRAALAGLVMGLFGSAAIFLVAAWQNAHVECTPPDTAECSFEVTAAAEIARLQGWSALGFVLLGAGLSVAMRRK